MAFEGNRAVRRDTIIAGLILVVALALFVLPPDYQEPVREGIRTTVLRPFLIAQSRIAHARAERVQLDAVRTERDSLLAVATAQRSVVDENRRLRAMLGLRERVEGGLLPAEAVRLDEPGAESTFYVTVGREAEVRPGAAVLSPGGLLGVVRLVQDRVAQAIDWSHPEFRVGAMTDDGEAYGIVEARRGRFREENMLALVGAPFHSDIPAGTRIVTSGRGGLLPRGIPLGTVVGIEEADTGWRKSYLLRPAARPESSRHVLVALPTAHAAADLSRAWNVTAPPDTAAGDTLGAGVAAADTAGGDDG